MNSFAIILTTVIGALLTYYVNVNMKQDGVRASALLSLLVGLFFYYQPELLNQYLTTNIPLVFIGASFIGMATPRVIPHVIYLVLAGMVFGFIYLNTSHFFNGFGGALGTTAFSSLLVTFGVTLIFRKREHQ